MALIAPSLLAADAARLGEALQVIKAAGAPMVHVDVRDGHFVPDISMGQPVIASLRKATDLVLDVHLLIERPERYAAEFVQAGADRLAVQAEAAAHLSQILSQIRARGAKAGIAVSPSTPLNSLAELWEEIDFVALWTSEPSDSQGRFLPRMLEKVQAASAERVTRRLDFAIEAEGGIGVDNWEDVARAGADILVMDSDIFDTESPQTRLAEVVRMAAGVRATSRV